MKYGASGFLVSCAAWQAAARVGCEARRISLVNYLTRALTGAATDAFNVRAGLVALLVLTMDERVKTVARVASCPEHTGHDQIDAVTRGLGEHIAADASQHSQPDVGVAFEDSTDEIHRQMVVKEPEAGLCRQLDAYGVFADSRRAVEEDQFHLV